MKICSFCHTKVKSLETKSPAACKKCYYRYLYEDKRNSRQSVECEFKISNKCEKYYNISLRAEQKNRKRNDGHYICLQCSRTLKYSGRKNPNCKYDIPDFFFADINSDIKAYILGWVASDGHISERGMALSIHKRDVDILNEIKNCICREIPIKSCNHDMVCITLNSQQISRDLCRNLRISPGKKSDVVMFPDFLNDDLKWSFIRGFFDGDGGISSVYAKKGIPGE